MSHYRVVFILLIFFFNLFVLFKCSTFDFFFHRYLYANQDAQQKQQKFKQILMTI